GCLRSQQHCAPSTASFLRRDALLFRLFYFTFRPLLGGVCFLRTQTKTLQSASQTMPVSQSGENGVARDVWKPAAEILRDERGRDILTKLQIGIGCQSGLIAVS